jgi:AcrR family transcriptional regulator
MVSSRSRILDAATTEFVEHGMAGARVDRIAELSGLSKPMLYSYFGGKEKLFDAVFEAHVIGNGERVPFTADGLPGYASRLYDDYLTDPALVRLLMWKRLERDGTGYLFTGLEHRDARHVRDIEEQQRAGRVRSDIDARDLWSLLIATAATWAQGSITEVAIAGDPESTHERRRAALVAYLGGALAP